MNTIVLMTFSLVRTILICLIILHLAKQNKNVLITIPRWHDKIFIQLLHEFHTWKYQDDDDESYRVAKNSSSLNCLQAAFVMRCSSVQITPLGTISKKLSPFSASTGWSKHSTGGSGPNGCITIFSERVCVCASNAKHYYYYN